MFDLLVRGVLRGGQSSSSSWPGRIPRRKKKTLTPSEEGRQEEQKEALEEETKKNEEEDRAKLWRRGRGMVGAKKNTSHGIWSRNCRRRRRRRIEENEEKQLWTRRLQRSQQLFWNSST